MIKKAEYQEIYRKIKETINLHDPMGLLGMGAPDDEYENEISKIVSLCSHDLEENKKYIDKVFFDFFDEKLEKNLLEKIAKDITNIMEKKD